MGSTSSIYTMGSFVVIDRNSDRKRKFGFDSGADAKNISGLLNPKKLGYFKN